MQMREIKKEKRESRVALRGNDFPASRMGRGMRRQRTHIIGARTRGGSETVRGISDDGSGGEGLARSGKTGSRRSS